MRNSLREKGFKIIENIYSSKEIDEILTLLDSKEIDNKFGIREFLMDHPEIQEKVFTKKLKKIIHQIAPNCHKSIKSIYFDKPPSANWIVNWHQDLTINLRNRKEVENYKNWRTKEDRVVVQPDLDMLDSIFTIRIHLDDCKKENGALRIIESSHRKGVIQISDWIIDKAGKERICEVNKGGVLVMKPLVLHASRRTENNLNRRIFHIEFTEKELPKGLEWKERIEI